MIFEMILFFCIMYYHVKTCDKTAAGFLFYSVECDFIIALNSKGESENSLVKVVKTTEEKKSDEGGSTQTPTIVLGDLNHDGKCNLLDASITL